MSTSGTADGRLLEAPRKGGAAFTLAKTGNYPSDIAVDQEYVDWVTRSEASILVRTPK